jgi:LCP family protein required for cell wall assembly
MTRRQQPRRGYPAPPNGARRGYEREPYAYAYEETAAWETAPAAPRRPRRRRSLVRTFALITLFLLLPLAVVVVLIGGRAAAFNDRVSTAPFLSTALFGPLNGEERVNILLVGYGGEQHEGGYLADSINILSIDPQTDTTTTIPVPRDLWIEGIGQLPANGRVNEAFAMGETNGGIANAGQLLAEVLTEVTGLNIEHWMAIDFGGFAEMVDAVGGVTVDNPTAFSYTTNETFHQQGLWTTGSFEAGSIELNGDEALAYTRARYTSVQSESTDFARSVRQARVLAGLRSKLGSGGIGAIGPGLGMMDALEGRLMTDLSAIDLFLVSGHITSDRRVELSEDVALFATRNTIGQYVLIPTGWTGPGSYGSLHAYITDELAEPMPSASPSPAGAP